MSPNSARTLFGRFERKAIRLDKAIGKVAVDTNCILYIHYSKVMSSYHKWDPVKARYAFDNHRQHMHDAVLYAICACQELLEICVDYFSECNIEVTFAFDGLQPPAKLPVLTRRARKVATARKIVRRVLALSDPTVADLKKYYANITASIPPSDAFYDRFAKFISGRGWKQERMPFEVDECCSQACALGRYDALVSNDWDPLLFGCPLVIREVPRRDRLVTYVRLSDVLSGLTVNRDELCAICILSGVDYNYEYDYASPVDNHRKLVSSGRSVDEMRRCTDIDEHILRWNLCKSVYKIG